MWLYLSMPKGKQSETQAVLFKLKGFIMHKEELIKLIFDAYDNDLESTVNPIPIDNLLNLSTSQLWAIAISLDILGDELP